MSIPHVYGHLDTTLVVKFPASICQQEDYKTGIYCFSLSEEKEQRLFGLVSG
jgi:hypothetical protein